MEDIDDLLREWIPLIVKLVATAQRVVFKIPRVVVAAQLQALSAHAARVLC
jgi:hypothetical protein